MKIVKTIIVFSSLFLVWHLLVKCFEIRPTILPSPFSVISCFFSNFPLIIKHSWDSIQSILLGFVGSSVLAFSLGVIIGYNPKLKDWLIQPLVLTQVIPKVTIAPMILLWFGSGILGKAVIAGLISFFPILTNTIVGINEIDKQYLDLFKINQASPLHELVKLRIPNALIFIHEAIRLSFIYCIIGVVTAEFIKPGKGIGDLILTTQNDLRTSLMFASILAISIFGLTGWFMFDFVGHKYYEKYKLS